MATLSFPILLPPVAPVVPPPPVTQLAPAAGGALLLAEAEALPLPASQPASAPAQPGAAQDGAAMRPDQVVMARQLSWPSQDGARLADNWRGMVRGYGSQLAEREQQARAGQLPGALLQSGQDPRILRQGDLGANPLDAWRFTVHAGATQAQHLRVVDEGQEGQSGQEKRRRRGRAALRLELVLEDGVVVTLQALPAADGVRLELCALDRATLARLRALQPQLEAAVGRAGLRVLGWTWRDTLPQGPIHARLPSAEAAFALSQPVFRAMAEMALLLPARLPSILA